MIIGFTRDSSEPSTAWREAIVSDPRLPESLPVWSAVVLDGIPRLIRGFVERGIRGGAPEALHDRFLFVRDGREDWEALAGWSEADPDAAYVVRIDPTGAPCARASGREVDEVALAALLAPTCPP